MLNANFHFSRRFVSQGILNKTTYKFLFMILPAVGVGKEGTDMKNSSPSGRGRLLLYLAWPIKRAGDMTQQLRAHCDFAEKLSSVLSTKSDG